MFLNQSILVWRRNRMTRLDANPIKRSESLAALSTRTAQQSDFISIEDYLLDNEGI